MPWMLAALAGGLQQQIEQQGRKLLSRPRAGGERGT
jgi:hypothetical protein